MDTVPPPSIAAAERLSALRAACVTAGVDGYLVPHGDEHQGEYAAPYAERLKWLTGFAGSAGLAVVLGDRAAIFVDGRYTLQVRDQVDGALYQYRHLIEEPATAWLTQNVGSGRKIGFDPRLHTPGGLARLEEVAAKIGAALTPLVDNLIDRVWTGQPPRPLAPVVVYPEKFAGRSSAEKRALIAKVLKGEGINAFFLTALDSIAWLFNIRGGDVEFSPLTYAYAVLFADGKAVLFIDSAKVSAEVIAHLGPDVRLAPYDGVEQEIDALDKSVAIVGLDRDTGSRWAYDRLSAGLGVGGRKVRVTADPCTALKACKHPTELQGVRDAHVRDGAALTRFLAWLSSEGPKGQLTEITAAERLEKFRGESNTFRGASFATIAGAAGNGAIVHYRASPKTAARIKPDMVLLLDSGGQYLDGTTDVTRTVAIGQATPEQRNRFTLVLKGHIALASARFVKGTTGGQLDALARHALWQEGLDYDHGTGHGVGTYLGVHEGPHRISKVGNTVALEPGMVVSVEPGYYKTGEFGIRIENLVAVREAPQPPGAEKALLEFETLTLAPIDLNMIEGALMTDAEKTWLNGYHARVRETLAPLVDAETKAWLATATRAVV
ncbi:MAG: aminopeptidase P family protein [Rhodospirillaceae bacterium]|nr:aminopeptidase P family protein [Rhodospirillaceae bacterium]